jgi:hypothetical protein
MKAIEISALLAVTAVLAGCSDRGATTAPAAEAVALSPSGVIGDRPYTWTVKCSGDFASLANWSWTAGGVTITGSQTSVLCFPGAPAPTGSGTRPATADGFSACVNAACQSWAFDPSGAFKKHLTGSNSQLAPGCDPFVPHFNQKCLLTATATLTVDS